MLQNSVNQLMAPNLQRGFGLDKSQYRKSHYFMAREFGAEGCKQVKIDMTDGKKNYFNSWSGVETIISSLILQHAMLPCIFDPRKH